MNRNNYKSNNIEEIRRLLDAWYDASLSKGEEVRLRESLLHLKDLPADLKADRDFFLALQKGTENEMAIPNELDSLILAGMEKEMKHRPFFSRRIWWAAAGIAVAVFGIFITPKLMEVEEIQEAKLQAVAEKHSMVIATDTAHLAYTQNISVSPQQGKLNFNKEEADPRRSHLNNEAGKRERQIRNPEVELSVAAADKGESSGNAGSKSDDKQNFLSYSEEQQLIGKNYHVVSDSQEAEKILSSIFTKMENTIEVQDARMSHIATDYENRVGQTNEEINTLNNRYHESQPL